MEGWKNGMEGWSPTFQPSNQEPSIFQSSIAGRLL